MAELYKIDPFRRVLQLQASRKDELIKRSLASEGTGSDCLHCVTANGLALP